jgi:sterol desaturase/sphingolipid hydroxylase (fatty acid hydroxylase superfamily)
MTRATNNSDADAIDTNFAVHLPFIDRLFGTLFAPRGRWPSRTGVVGFRAPDGFWGQQASVFERSARKRRHGRGAGG